MTPRVLFLTDQLASARRTEAEGHPGGAELTDEAAIEACPWPLETALSATCRPRDLDGFDIHVVSNLKRATPELLVALASRGRHILFEHDIRICRYSGNWPGAAEKIHRFAQRCFCPFLHLRALYRRARGVIFLTQRQRTAYQANPWYWTPGTILGSSLMARSFWERVEAHRRHPVTKSIDTAIVYSPQWIKGTALAERY